MKPHSAKAKGRRCAVEVKELLHKYAPDLRVGDILVTSSGVCGEDVLFSPLARRKYPFVIECKNKEKLNIWDAYEQAKGHLVDKDLDQSNYIPIVFFKRNKSKLMVCLDAEEFIRMVS